MSGRRALPTPRCTALVILLALLTTPGCLTFLSTVKLNPDGTGTVEEEVLLSNMLAGVMTNMIRQSDTTGTRQELFSEDEVRERALEMGKGVRFVSMERIATARGQGYRAVYAFDDINTLELDQDPGNRVPDVGIQQAEAPTADAPTDLRFHFDPGAPATLSITLPQEEPSPTEATGEAKADSSQMNLMRGMFQDMRMRMAIELQGKITETNATHRSGNRVTLYDFDFNELMKDDEQFRTFLEMNSSDLQTAELQEMSAEDAGAEGRTAGAHRGTLPLT